jgi:hypothetical protein
MKKHGIQQQATRKPGFLLRGQESNKLKCSFPQAVRE